MARIRSVHPGLFTDEAFMALSLPARMLWIGLWTEADDQGVFEWKPLTLKARIFPVDNVDSRALLSELEDADKVRRYEVDGREYGALRNFRKFQRPKSPTAVHPLPPEFRTYVGLTQPNGETHGDETPPCPRKREKSPQMEDGGGRMKDGEEDGKKTSTASPEAPPTRGSRFAIEKLPDEWLAFCKQERPELDPERVFIEFRDYWISVAGARGRKLDWFATWRNRVRDVKAPGKSLFDPPKPATREEIEKWGRA